jgi:hypothetical protein
MANRLEPSGFAEFDRLTDLFGRTRAVLGAVLVEQGVPTAGSELIATETLPHIEDVEAGMRTYADIPVPRSPAELALRIEEIERELWRTATGRPPARVDGAYRRTYGFFDTAERLASRPFHLNS